MSSSAHSRSGPSESERFLIALWDLIDEARRTQGEARATYLAERALKAFQYSEPPSDAPAPNAADRFQQQRDAAPNPLTPKGKK